MNDKLLQRYLTNVVADIICACEQYAYCVFTEYWNNTKGFAI